MTWLATLATCSIRKFGVHDGLHNVGDSLWSFVGPHFEALMVVEVFMLQVHVTRHIHDRNNVARIAWNSIQHAAFAQVGRARWPAQCWKILFGALLLHFLRLSWWWKLLCYLARFDHAKIMWLGWLGLQYAAFRNFSLHNGLHNVGDSLWSFLGAHFKALMVEDALMACYKTYSW